MPVTFWLLCFVLFTVLSPGVLGTPSPQVREVEGRDGNKVPLRILPLGASITWGYLSTTGNGYRKPLRDKLRFEGWEVDMVGSRDNGTMKDNDVEAREGNVINQVHTAAFHSLKYKPNIVLINAGTNDCERGVNISGAGERMRELIDTLVTAPGMNDTVIILSTLIPSALPKLERNRALVNQQFRGLVSSLQAQRNISILLADMDPPAPAAGHNWFVYPDDYADNKHPNDYGYKMMASVWYDAIVKAATKGVIPHRTPLIVSPNGTCGTADAAGGYARGSSRQDSRECVLKDHTGDDGPLTDPNLPKMPKESLPTRHWVVAR